MTDKTIIKEDVKKTRSNTLKHIRTSKETDLKLKQIKLELGLNYSETIHILVNGGFPYTKVFFNIRHELKKQGVNLNQITKHINTTKQIDNDVYIEIQEMNKNIAELILLLKETKHNIK